MARFVSTTPVSSIPSHPRRSYHVCMCTPHSDISTGRSRKRAPRERLEQLQKFKTEHGHVSVPYSDPSGLGRWIAEQRHKYQKGLVDDVLYRELISVGLVLRPLEARWDARFQQMCEFHSTHGHAFVQHKDSVPDGLYGWVLQQRQLKKQGRLDESRLKRLDALGFVWDVQAHLWRQNMECLREFYEEHGHCRVSKGGRKDSRLHNFLRRIQSSSKKGFEDVPYATQDDVEKLHAWGAVRAYRTSWDEKYNEMCNVKSECRKNGRIPYQYLKESGLTAWARSQRFVHRQGIMSAEQYALLDTIGFDWDGSGWSWLTRVP